MKMKRGKVVLLTLVLVLPFIIHSSVSRAYGKVETLNQNTDDFEAIKKLETQARYMLKDLYVHDTNNEFPENVRIDFGSAEKVYVDAPIFNIDDESTEEIEKQLKQSDYIWLVNVDIDGETYGITFSKGMPLREEVTDFLTEEEIKAIKRNEGKWHVSCVDHAEVKLDDYGEIVDTALEEINYSASDSKVVICGGLQHIQNPVAIVMDDEAQLLIPMEEMEVEGTPEQIDDAKPNGADESDEVYLYSAIKDAVNDMDSENNGIAGSGAAIVLSSKKSIASSRIVVFSIVGICAILLVVCSVVQSKKRHG